MKFEEALTKMREGAKIRCEFMPEDEHYAACYVHLKNIDPYTGKVLPQTKEQMAESRKNGMSIVWMKGSFQHEGMKPKNWPNIQPCCEPGLHSCPQLNLLWIMCDNWEIVE